MTEGDSGEKKDITSPDTNKALTIEELDKRYMPREVCIIRATTMDKIGESVEQTRIDIGEIKEILAMSTEWMKSHQELHVVVENTRDTTWKKLGIAAALVATLLTGISMGAALLITVLKYKP